MENINLQTTPQVSNNLDPQPVITPAADAGINMPPTMSTTMDTAPMAKPKKSKLIFIVLAILLVLLTAGGVFGYIFLQKNEKTKAADVIAQQLTNIDTLQTQYRGIIDLLKAGRLENSEKQNSTFSNLLGVQDVRIDENSLENSELPSVLGIEDIPMVKVSRSYISKLQEAQRTLKELNSQNTKVQETFDKFIVTKANKSTAPFDDTKAFASKSESLLHYYEQMELLNLDFISWGVDIWSTIQRSIVAGADEASVAKVEDAISNGKQLKSKAIGIDTSNLDEKQKTEHKEFVDSFDTEMKPFDTIVAALKAKDGLALQKAIVDTTLEGASGVEQGTMGYVTEWQSNALLSGIPDLKTKWEKFAELYK